MMNKQLLAFFFLIVFMITSCGENSDNSKGEGLVSIPSSKSGLDFKNTLTDTEDQNIIQYLYYYNGAGVAVGDINNDGLDDVFFSSNQGSCKLFLNEGKLKFKDITKQAGIIEDKGWSTGVTMDDVNNDGFLDIYVCKVSKYSGSSSSAHNLLYLNNGNGTFTESSQKLGVDFVGYSTQSCFLDYDHDGDLDMYLLNHNVHSVNSYGKVEKRTQVDPLAGDILFENKISDGDGFVNVSKKAGIYSSPLGYGLAVTASDINQDGWTDIYVGNDFHENDYIYLNNGDGTFTESVKKLTPHTTQFSMGVDVADMNGDGAPDIFATDMMPYDEEVLLTSAGEDSDNIKRIKSDFGYEPQSARNHFLLNRGNGTFSDIAYMTRTFATDWSWSVLLQDFNNDGKNDILVSNGIVKRPNNLDYINYLNEFDQTKATDPNRAKSLIAKMPSQALPNILFTQTGDLAFTSINESKFGKASFSTGAAYSDLDGDGDLDLVMNNINEDAFLYENKSSDKGINITLDNGRATSKGTIAICFSNGSSQYKELQTTKGFMSSSSHSLHFGLGASGKVDSILIIWPEGGMETIINPQTDGFLNIKRGSGVLPIASRTAMNKETESAFPAFPYLHEDNKFYDENNEKLIPKRLSYEGPCILVEDLTGDGLKDIYIGGGRNSKARLLVATGNGYTDKVNVDFNNDAKYEDVSVASIDFDNDGDRDLYVVSGGNDNKEMDKILEDRIYLNNGNGVFKRIPISLPHTNGSTVSVADFDKDGFEDIFIGARSIPGQYGLSPYSFLLRNNGGMGVEITLKVRYGMVTDSEWTDLDGDGFQDLVMCGDWMPITVLKNNGKGGFDEVTKTLGLDTKVGFWNAIAAYDYNKDGMLDIIAGNAGLNQKWTASDSLPIKMYVGDFDKNGSSEPLIYYHYMTGYIPFSSFDKMISQMPFLKKANTSYDFFKSNSSVDKLVVGYKDMVVEEKSVNELRSTMFLSNKGSYEAIPLGKMDQLSEIRDIKILENGDAVYVGNHSQYAADLGMSVANSGSKMSGFDVKTKTFKYSKYLSLPLGIDARKIGLLEGDKFVVSVNRGYVYVVKG